MSAAALRSVKRLADSLVVLASARETAGWKRVASVDEIHEISVALDQALNSEPESIAAIKADALREAAQVQRQYATDARTQYGEAEHTNIADWLDDQANLIDPRRLEGAHP